MSESFLQRQERSLKPIHTLTAAGLLAIAIAAPAAALDISGAGATFPYPIYAKWADVYKGPFNSEVQRRGF
jgi:ABC-type phosphate transport system substrate-binding protein